MEVTRPDLVTNTGNSLIVDAKHWKTIKNKRVCSRHFTEDCYERDLMKELIGAKFKTKPLKLKRGAIPTLDLNLPDDPKPSLPKEAQNKPDRVEGAIRIGPDGKIIVVEKKVPVEPEEIVEIPDVDDPEPVEEDSQVI